jgi:hypothetical protein
MTQVAEGDRVSSIEKRLGSVVVLQPKAEIANLLSVQQPNLRLGTGGFSLR